MTIIEIYYVSNFKDKDDEIGLVIKPISVIFKFNDYFITKKYRA